MKKLLVFLLSFFLVSCTSKPSLEFNLVEDNNYKGEYSLYYYSDADEGSVIDYSMTYEVDNEKIHIIDNMDNIYIQDEYGIVQIGNSDITYDISDQVNLYKNNVYPYLFVENEVDKVKKTDTGYECTLKDETIINAFGFEDTVIDENTWIIDIEDGKIVKEVLSIKYHEGDVHFERIYTNTYEYDCVSLDFDYFDYLNDYISEYRGRCVFDESENTVFDIVIEDNETIEVTETVFFANEFILQLFDDIDYYCELLDRNYNQHEGLTAEVTKEENGVRVVMVGDVKNMSDEALRLIDVNRNGAGLMNKLRTKGYQCD